MDPKAITKQLQTDLDSQGWSVVSFDREESLSIDLLQGLSLWRLGEKVWGKHASVLPSSGLRKEMWNERDNKWFKEGRGAAWAHRDDETGFVVSGICVLVSFEKGSRLDSMTGADVFLEMEDD